MNLKKHLLNLVSSTIFALSVSSISSAAEATDMHLNVHVYPGNPTSLYSYIAEKKGFYKAAGVDVQLVNIATGPQANAALASGSIDIALSSADHMLMLKQQKFDPVIISSNLVQPLFLLVARKGSDFPNRQAGFPKMVDDFNGKTIGVYGRGSASDRFVRQLLRDAGKSTENVNFAVVSGPAQSIAGLIAGQLDAVTEVFGGLIMAELTDTGTALLDCSVSNCPKDIQEAGKMAQVYFALRDNLTRKEKAVSAFVAAHKQVNEWAHDPKNRDELEALIGSVLTTPPNVSPEKYTKRMAEDMQRYFGVKVHAPALRVIEQQLMDSGEVKARLDLDTMIWDKAPQ